MNRERFAIKVPLPLGHALAGAAIATVFTSDCSIQNNLKFFLFCVFLSLIPDFDLGFVHIFGLDRNIFHRTFSHSVCFAVCTALVLVCLNLVNQGWSKWKLFSVYFLIILSHSVLDFFSVDSHPPTNGIMIFWPFSTKFFISPIPIFPSVDSSKNGMYFMQDILREIGTEALLLGAILLGVLKFRGKGRTSPDE